MNVKFNVTSNRCLNCHLVLSVSFSALAKHKNDLVAIKAADMMRNIEHGKEKKKGTGLAGLMTAGTWWELNARRR